jgi:hypothetical protein
MAILSEQARLTVIQARACLKDVAAGWEVKELSAPINEIIAGLGTIIDGDTLAEEEAPVAPPDKGPDAWEVFEVQDHGKGLVAALKDVLNALEKRGYQVFKLERSQNGSWIVIACNPSMIGSTQSKALADMVAGLQRKMQGIPGYPSPSSAGIPR